MLTFVGLGLYDQRSITIAGREAIATADHVVAELYTSRLMGATIADLAAYHDVTIDTLDRTAVERDPERLLTAAADEAVVFLTGGDPMVATTHVDLRLRAAERGIDTRIVHGTSAATAAASLTGLQNYRFGKATTLPFPDAHGASDAVPPSVIETITANRDRDLHTVVYLDIEVPAGQYGRRAGQAPTVERYLGAARAADLLAGPLGDPLAVAVCRAGSATPTVRAGRCRDLAEDSFGDPLHLLVVPGALHDLERAALETFAGLEDADADATATD